MGIAPSAPTQECAAILIGDWPENFHCIEQDRIGRPMVRRCATQASELRRALLSARPTWLVIGQGLDEDIAWSAMASALRIMPEIRLAAIGPAGDFERCECWVRRGASAYLAPPLSLAGLLADLEFSTQHDRLIIDACFHRAFLQQQRSLGVEIMAETTKLTRRELEIVQLLCRGLRNADIATTLYVTVATVDFHMRNILAKLGVKNRTEAAERARLFGLAGRLRKNGRP